MAIQNGYTDLAQKLIDLGSNLNLQDSKGRYAYVYVIYQSIDFITKSLWKPRTALHLAIDYGYLQLVEKLIESGANLDLQDSNGRYVFKIQISFSIHWFCWNLRTVLHLTIQNGYNEMATNLIDVGANLDLQDSSGR